MLARSEKGPDTGSSTVGMPPGCPGGTTIRRESPRDEGGRRRADDRAGTLEGVPEGDTVWLAAQRMNTALAGSTLRRGEFRLPQLAALDLTGTGVREVVPRGKHLLIRLADDRTLRTHFRMDGSWHIYRPGTKWRGGPAYDIRVVLATPEWECVGYQIGRASCRERV